MPVSPIALGLLIGFAALGAVITIDLTRNNTNPLHNPSDDDADFDPHVVKLGRRVGGMSSFHEQES